MEKKVPWIVKTFDYKMWFHDFVKITGALLVLLDLRMKRVYINKTKRFFSGRYIVASNHVSFEDPVILLNAFWKRRLGFIATIDLFKNKFSSLLFTGFGCIPINKQKVSLSTFKKLKERLDRGHVVCVFPEGTVSRTKELGEFKNGTALMACMSSADIIPVYICKRTSRWQRQVVIYGERLRYHDYFKSTHPSQEEIDKVTKVLKEKELELEAIYKEKYYKEPKAKKDKNKAQKNVR